MYTQTKCYLTVNLGPVSYTHLDVYKRQIMYLGTTTCTSAFFSDLTSNIALMELRSVEINVIRNFLDKEIGSRRDKFFLANDINLEIEFKDVSFKFQENGEYILRHVNPVSYTHLAFMNMTMITN